MSYQALYRVWRPRQLRDVAGQEHITRTLKNALAQQKLSHAYLFTGPRGTGKTSAAKIVAKAVNCREAPASEPCNECDICLGIQDGSIVDVMEIDAASNNGVDEIRDIRDKVRFAPSTASYKVYIIDEVHMLTTGAFNALLKTLEEPPPHVLFILATTEPHKIPLTIISRCQRFDFKRITAHAMLDRMREIVGEMELQVEEDALSLIARASEGGMRDALSLLDQAVSFAEEKVTTEDILAVIGSASRDHLYDIVEAVRDGSVGTGLEKIDILMEEGKDPNRLLEDLLFFFRDALMIKAAPQLEESQDRVRADDRFQTITEQLEQVWIFAMIERLNHFQQEMKWASHPQVFLEMFIVQASQQPAGLPASEPAQAPASSTVEALEQKITALERSLKRMQQEGVPAAGGASAQTSEAPARQRKRSKPAAASAGKGGDSRHVAAMLNEAEKAELQQLQSSWGGVLEQVKQQSVPASAWLNDCQPKAASADKFVLVFKNELHRGMVEEKFRDMVESTVGQQLGNMKTLLTLVEEDWEAVKQAFVDRQRKGGVENASEEAVGEAPPAEEEPGNPLVDEAVRMVGEDLIEVKD
ncbi:DNA polymerase III subunit gamma/tau [Alkalicoccus chagannorensis]|uniref:DNA polymerase III subunit gamma/tau n=1 Tax=Alkalicoccus chagannorensis TaxID=427072 RepID=UPI00041C607F|nr:DNA polymerase III subunit gamma/tau [Alkalicoccus chagannorensis]